MIGVRRSKNSAQTVTIPGKQVILVVLWAVLLLAAITVGVAFGYYFASRHVIVVPQKSTSIYTSTEGALLKTQIEYYEKRADDLQRLVSALTGLSALFALVAGVTTYVNLTNSVAAARALLEEVKVDVERVREDYPKLGFMNQAVNQVIEDLTAMTTLLEPKDPASGIYLFRRIKKNGEKFSRLLFYEKVVSALSLLDIRGHEKNLSKVYRVLGLFYASRAYDDRNIPDIDDLELGCFYLNRAYEFDPDDHLAMAEMGRFLVSAGNDFSYRAEDALRKSLAVFTDQQWPWMNLSHLYLMRKRYDSALEAVERGLACKCLSVPGDDLCPEPLYFNGVYAMIGLGRLDDAVHFLEKACDGNDRDRWRKQFQKNLDEYPEDPLHRLVESKHADQVGEILDLGD